ncbi:MAG: hypothetical protein HY809_08345 [Nitrospirae bacterium]|nr:hypothetical protein [Nitrospirota bacterium]
MEDPKHQKMKTLFLVFAILIFPLIFSAGAGRAFAENEIHLSDELSFTFNDISGPGSASSSLTEGTRYLNILGINGSGTVSSFDYTFNVGSKATDDERNDVKTLSLTNFLLKLTDKINTLNAGDTFESFSQYSLTTALKGASYRFYNETSNTPQITLVYGLAYPRWDNVWRDDDTKTIERTAYGGRIRYDFTSEFSAGASAVRSEDDNRLISSDPLSDNTIYEVDAEYKPIPGLTLKAEAAFNSTDTSAQEGSEYMSSHGYAWKAEAVGDGGPSRVALEYERVAPDFVTFLGSATADREKFKANWRYKHSKMVGYKTGFLWYRDNLDGQKSGGRTDHYKPEIGVTVKNILNRQYAVGDFAYKLDISEKNGDNVKTDNIVTVNYRDRFGIFDSDANLGYTSYDSKDVSDREEFTYNLALNSRHTSGRFILKPSLYLGGWSAHEELSDDSDVIYEYSAGLGLDVPDLKITSNMKVGQNKLEKEAPGADDSSKLFANLSIYYRPAFLSSLNYGMLFLRGYVNDFTYTTGTRDFRETSVTAGINIQL